MTEDPTPKKPLTPADKANWNKFIDFVKMQNMAGNPQLDQRNKQLGMALLQKYNYSNPQQALPMDVVPRVQQDLQDQRAQLVSQFRSGKGNFTPDVKSEDDIMSGISPVDGWPGSKTLAHKFPVAQAVTVDNGKKTVQDFGTDMQAYANAKGK